MKELNNGFVKSFVEKCIDCENLKQKYKQYENTLRNIEKVAKEPIKPICGHDEPITAYEVKNRVAARANELILKIEKIKKMIWKTERILYKDEIRTEKIYSSQVEELEISLNHLKQENKRLKQQLAEIGKSWDEIQRLKRENEKLNKMTGIFSARLYEKYHTTLQEIKKIAEDAKRDICNNCGWRNTESCDPEDYTCGEFIKILQKINKAEEE